MLSILEKQIIWNICNNTIGHYIEIRENLDNSLTLHKYTIQQILESYRTYCQHILAHPEWKCCKGCFSEMLRDLQQISSPPSALDQLKHLNTIVERYLFEHILEVQSQSLKNIVDELENCLRLDSIDDTLSSNN